VKKSSVSCFALSISRFLTVLLKKKKKKKKKKIKQWHWPILHAIGLSATTGFLIHQVILQRDAIFNCISSPWFAETPNAQAQRSVGRRTS
jgi:hypothetical protein